MARPSTTWPTSARLGLLGVRPLGHEGTERVRAVAGPRPLARRGTQEQWQCLSACQGMPTERGRRRNRPQRSASAWLARVRPGRGRNFAPNIGGSLLGDPRCLDAGVGALRSGVCAGPEVRTSARCGHARRSPRPMPRPRSFRLCHRPAKPRHERVVVPTRDPPRPAPQLPRRCPRPWSPAARRSTRRGLPRPRPHRPAPGGKSARAA
jgi:hypothetical protein